MLLFAPHCYQDTNLSIYLTGTAQFPFVLPAIRSRRLLVQQFCDFWRKQCRLLRAARIALWFLGFLGCIQSTPANSLTFAQFTDAGTQNFILTNNTDGSQTFSINGPVQFSYTNIARLPVALSGSLPAILTMTADSNQNVGITTISGSRYAYVGGFSGNFQFTLSNYEYNGSSDLLHGTFRTQAVLIGVQSGQSATFSDSNSAIMPTEVNFSSQMVAIAAKQENFALSLSSIFDTQIGDAGLNVGGPGNTDVDNFVASATGTFASDPVPFFLPEGKSINYFGVGFLFLAFGCGRHPAVWRKP